MAIAFGIGWALDFRSPESGRDRAVRFCKDCGLTATDVDRLIDDISAVGATAEQARALWEATYSDPAELEAAREACGDCVEAVVGASG